MRHHDSFSRSGETAIAARRRRIAPARQGLIVQCVLVEGWSVAEAAAAFSVEERQVERWIAAFRRRGMASLREAPGRSPAGTRGGRGRIAAARRKIAAIWRRLFPAGLPPVPPNHP